MPKRNPWPTPIPVRRALERFGKDVETWRKLNQLTAAQVADRAGVSPPTLRSLERGEGGVSLENVFRISRALGILDLLAAAIDPYSTDAGQLRSDQRLPQRVRRPRG
jgi:transcriptional regulator with XRE-family HTH domain